MTGEDSEPQGKQPPPKHAPRKLRRKLEVKEQWLVEGKWITVDPAAKNASPKNGDASDNESDSPDNESDSPDTDGASPKNRKKKTRPKKGECRWMISGIYVNGKRRREFFSDPDSARLRLQALEIAEVNTEAVAAEISGNADLLIGAAKARQTLKPLGVDLLTAAQEYAACREALAESGLSLVEVVKEAVERHQARQRSLTLKALGERFQSDPETAKRAETYRKDSRRRWMRFSEDLGPGTMASDVSPDDVRRWLAGLPVGDVSKGNYHRNLGAVFAYGVHAGLIHENPFRKVKKPTVEAKDGVEVFTPGQMKALLSAADPEWLPILAIGGFAGLRPFEIKRLAWEEIDLKGKFIEVKASKSKTGQRRLVPISPNLAAWLRPYAGQDGPIRPDGMPERRLRIEAMERAKVEEWPVDVLRHSFASYHLAFHKDINETALELGHQSTKMLFQHYREAVTPKAAREWWALRPPPRKGDKSPPAKRKK